MELRQNVHKNWAYFCPGRVRAYVFVMERKFPRFLRLDYDRKKRKHAKTFMIICVKPK